MSVLPIPEPLPEAPEPAMPPPTPPPTPPAVPPPPKRPSLLWRVLSLVRRILRWPIALLALVGLVAALVVYTGAGFRTAVQQSMPFVNDLFQGDILIGAVEGTVMDTLVLRDVRLVDGEGLEALRVDRLEVALDLRAFAENRVLIHRVVIDGLHVGLFDKRGEAIIGRVFRPMSPSPPEPSQGPGWEVILEDVVVRSGDLAVTAGEPPLVTDLSLALDLAIRGGGLYWSGLSLNAAVAPRAVPGLDLSRVGLRTRGQFANGGLRLDVLQVNTNEATLAGALIGRPDASGMALDFRLDRFAASLTALERLVGLRLGATTGEEVVLSGTAALAGGRATADLSLDSSLGDARVRVAAPLGGGPVEADLSLRSVVVPSGLVPSVRPGAAGHYGFDLDAQARLTPGASLAVDARVALRGASVPGLSGTGAADLSATLRGRAAAFTGGVSWTVDGVEALGLALQGSSADLERSAEVSLAADGIGVSGLLEAAGSLVPAQVVPWIARAAIERVWVRGTIGAADQGRPVSAGVGVTLGRAVVADLGAGAPTGLERGEVFAHAAARLLPALRPESVQAAVALQGVDAGPGAAVDRVLARVDARPVAGAVDQLDVAVAAEVRGVRADAFVPPGPDGVRKARVGLVRAETRGKVAFAPGADRLSALPTPVGPTRVDIGLGDVDAVGVSTREVRVRFDAAVENTASGPAVSVAGPIAIEGVRAAAGSTRVALDRAELAVRVSRQGDLAALLASPKDLSALKAFLGLDVGGLTAGAVASVPSGRVTVDGRPTLARPAATVTVSLRDPVLAGVPLERVDLEVSWPKLRDLSARVSVLSPRQAATLAADVRLPKNLFEPPPKNGPAPALGPIGVTVRELRLRHDSLSVTGAPGATVRYARGKVSWDKVALSLTHGGTALTGQFATHGSFGPGPRVGAALDARGIDLAPWAAFLADLGAVSPEVAGGIRGRLDAAIRADGPLAAPRLDARVTLADGAAAGLEPVALTLGLNATQGAHPRVRLDPLDVSWGDRHVHVDGTVPVGVRLDGRRPRLDRSGDVAATVHVSELDVAEALQHFVRGTQLPAGRASVDARVQGTLRAPRGEVTARVKGFSGYGVQPLDVTVQATADSASLQTQVDVAREGKRVVGVEAGLPVALVDTLLAGRPVVGALLSAPVKGTVTVAPMHLSTVLVEAPLGDPEVEASLALSGTPLALAVDGTADVRGLRADKDRLDSRVELGFEGGDTRISGNVRSNGDELAKLGGAIPGPLGAALLGRELAQLLTDPKLALTVALMPMKTQSLARYAPGPARTIEDLLGAAATVSGGVVVSGTPAGPRIGGRVAIDGPKSAAADTRDASGAAERPLPNGVVRSNGDPLRLVDDAVVSFAVEPYRTNVDVTVNQTVARPVRGQPTAVRGDGLFISVAAQTGTATLFDGPMRPLGSLPITGFVRSAGFDLGRLHTVLGALFGESPGALYADMDIAGTVDEPKVRGALRLRFDRLRFKPLGLDQPNADLTVAVRGNHVYLSPPFALRLGGGSLDLAFGARLAGPKPTDWALEGRLAMERYPILGREDISATLSGALDFGGTVARPRIAGGLTFDDLLVRPKGSGGREGRALGPPPDVVFVGPGGAPPQLAQLEAKAPVGIGRLVDLDLTVSVPRRAAHVKNENVDAYGQGELKISTKGDDLILGGEVRIADGRVSVLGREFILEADSGVVFDGAEGLDPVLAVKARYSLADMDLGDAASERGPDDHILFTLTGRASHPKATFSSEPALPETDVLAILTLGFLPNASTKDSAKAGDKVSNLLLGVVSASAAQLIQNRLPVDVFKVDAGADDLSKARITVGKRILRDLVLSYAANFGAKLNENKNEVRVQYELLRFMQIDSRYGDQGAGSADMVFFWRF